MVAGAGNDTASGGLEMDTLKGGDGDDRLYSGDDRDDLDGGDGRDLLDGGSGDDRLDGDWGDDVLDGGAGNDFLWASDGNDSLLGGDGIDDLNGYAGNDTLRGGAGDDSLNGSNEGGRMFAPAEVDILVGGAGQDWFELTGAYSHGGGLDKAIISDWNDGGDQDRIIAYDHRDIGPGRVSLVGTNKVEIYRQVLTPFGSTGFDLIAEVTSTALSGHAFLQNVIDHIHPFS